MDSASTDALRSFHDLYEALKEPLKTIPLLGPIILGLIGAIAKARQAYVILKAKEAGGVSIAMNFFALVTSISFLLYGL
jgi:uncharacterized protein with PQ loop repeat